MKCPNISYKTNSNQTYTDWEYLEGRVGVDQAYAYWLANNEIIPTPKQVDLLTEQYVSNVIKQSELTRGLNILFDKNGNKIPTQYVNEFTDVITAVVFNYLDNNETEDHKLSIKSIFKEVEQELIEFRDFHREIDSKEKLKEALSDPDNLDLGIGVTIKENQLIADYFDHILDNKEQYFDYAIERVQSLGYSVSKNKTELEIKETSLEQEDISNIGEEELIEEESTQTDRKSYEDDSTFYQDSLDKLSPLIKKIIAFIPSSEPSILNKTRFEDATEVYESLLSITADKEYSYEEMIQALRDSSFNKPYLNSVADIIENSSDKIKVQFAKHFRLSALNSKTLIQEVVEADKESGNDYLNDLSEGINSTSFINPDGSTSITLLDKGVELINGTFVKVKDGYELRSINLAKKSPLNRNDRTSLLLKTFVEELKSKKDKSSVFYLEKNKLKGVGVLKHFNYAKDVTDTKIGEEILQRFLIKNIKETAVDVTKGKVIATNRSAHKDLIKEEWANNSLESYLVKGTNKEGSYINKKRVEKQFKEAFQKIKENGFQVVDVQSWLNMIGINMSEEALQYLKDNSVKEFNKPFAGLFNDGSIFYGVYNYINNISEDVDFELDNPLVNENYITRLADIQTLFDSNRTTSNYKDGKGKSRYIHILPSWLSLRFNRLVSNKDNIINSLKESPLGKFSYYLSNWNNSVFKRNFVLDTFDVANFNGNALSFDEMNRQQKLITQINLFANRNNGNPTEKISVFMTPAKSDKKTLHTIQSMRYPLKSNRPYFQAKKLQEDDLKMMLNLVRSEYSRILDAQNRRESGVVYTKEMLEEYNPFMFYYFPELNNKEKFSALYDSEGLVKMDEDLLLELVGPHVTEIVYSQIEDLRAELTSEGIIKNGKLNHIDNNYVKFTEDKGGLEYFLADYIINYNIFRFNYDILFQGDLATANKKDNLDKTIANMFKRLAKDIAPSSRLAKINVKKNVDFYKYKQIVLNDTFTRSVNFDQIVKVLKDKHKAYGKIEGTDAQELTTLEEHLDVMYYYGDQKLSDKKYKELKYKAKAGKKFTPEELDLILQPIKPLHVSNRFDNKYGGEHPFYVKSSSFPLVPQLVKDTELEKLERVMRKKGIRRAAFKTAVKLGGYHTIDMWDRHLDKEGKETEFTNGIINEEKLLEALNNEDNIFTLDRDDFGIQQETPYKGEKESLKEGTQLAKLILQAFKNKDGKNGLDKDKIERFNDLHTDLQNSMFKAFLDKLGATEEADGSFTIKSIEPLQKMLIEELKESATGYTPNDLLALELNEDKTDFKIPIWASAKSEQYEALLNSIINKKVLEIKLPGRSFILGSEEGFKGNSEDITYVKDHKLIGTAYDSKTGLKPQRKGYVKNGVKKEESEYLELSKEEREGYKEVVFPAQVFATKGKFRNGKFVGYRIPTQGLNSMSAMEIVGYLPDYMGDLIVAPADFTKQMGSDFDIDKLYAHTWYENKKGEPYSEIDVEKEWEAINSSSFIKEALQLKDEVQASEAFDKALSTIFSSADFKYTEEEIKELSDAITNKYAITEEFKEQRRDKLKKNEIIDLMFNSLLDLDNLAEILAPLDSANLQEAYNNIIKADSSRAKSRYYLNPIREIDNYENGNAGKYGVAATSLTSTFNSLLLANEQDIELNLNYNFKIDGKEVNVKSLNDSPLTLDGSMKKADVFSAFQNVSVDNIKDLLIKILNYNIDTHNAFTTLSYLGLNDKYISYFLSQKVVIDYIKEIGKLNNEPISKGEKLNKAFNSIYNKLYSEDVNLDTLKDKAFSEEDLLKEIGNPKNSNQLSILFKFINLSRDGEIINDVIKSIQPVTSGIGKNRLVATNKTKRIVTAIPKLKGAKFLLETADNKKTIVGNGMEIIKKSNRILNRFFSINRIYDNLFTNVIENSGFISLKEREQQTMMRFVKSYLFSAQLGIYNGKTPEQYRKELLFGDNTLAKRWREFKQENPNSWLARRIIVKTTQSQKEPDTITYKSSIVDPKGDVKNIYELTDMLLSTDPITKQLAEDTIAYAYFTGGTQTSTSLVKFININYLNKNNFGIDINTFSKSINYSMLLEQYFQNYPQHAKIVKTENLDSTTGNVYLDSGKSEGSNYVSLRAKDKWKLFKLSQLNESGFFEYTELKRPVTSKFIETSYNKELKPVETIQEPTISSVNIISESTVSGPDIVNNNVVNLENVLQDPETWVSLQEEAEFNSEVDLNITQETLNKINKVLSNFKSGDKFTQYSMEEFNALPETDKKYLIKCYG